MRRSTEDWSRGAGSRPFECPSLPRATRTPTRSSIARGATSIRSRSTNATKASPPKGSPDEGRRVATTDSGRDRGVRASLCGAGVAHAPRRARRQAANSQRLASEGDDRSRLIERWFARSPGANVAVATGPLGHLRARRRRARGRALPRRPGAPPWPLPALRRAMDRRRPRRLAGCSSAGQTAARSATAPAGSGRSSIPAATAAMSCSRRRGPPKPIAGRRARPLDPAAASPRPAG